MKKLLIILFIIPAFIYGQGAQYPVMAKELTWHTDVNKAINLSVKKRKATLVFLYWK
jgi:p-aminobenzoyl-glutamate transporter AbgT